ncbi:hypothetical protein M8818_003861 [Zalaria obscura]|uniref:Uncharacterized protein n=1 Tax=Zalaria obscura TaxID=2024903 RepID=A0ACC3SEJ4_9PEZI
MEAIFTAPGENLRSIGSLARGEVSLRWGGYRDCFQCLISYPRERMRVALHEAYLQAVRQELGGRSSSHLQIKEAQSSFLRRVMLWVSNHSAALCSVAEDRSACICKLTYLPVPCIRGEVVPPSAKPPEVGIMSPENDGMQRPQQPPLSPIPP